MSLNVRIVTPRKVAWEGKAELVRAPGELGEFAVLPKHIAYLTTLRPGVVVVESGDTKLRYNIGVGFCEAGPEHVTILTETCEEG